MGVLDRLSRASLALTEAVFGPVDAADIGGRWVTVRGRRLLLDADGRVIRGGLPHWLGVHVQDIAALERSRRELLAADCAAVAGEAGPETFRTKDEAMAAVLAANPKLRDFMEANRRPYEAAWLSWARGRRRGVQPGLVGRRGGARLKSLAGSEAQKGDAEFDVLNGRWELRAHLAIRSWTAALWRTVPASYRWADLGERLAVLAEASGVPLDLPEQAERLRVSKLARVDCEAEVDRALGELIDKARTERIGGSEAAPF